MDPNKIEVGDTVVVEFSCNVLLNNCVVLHVMEPSAYGNSGECWHLRDKHGVLYYIQTYEIMTLVAKGGE